MNTRAEIQARHDRFRASMDDILILIAAAHVEREPAMIECPDCDGRGWVRFTDVYGWPRAPRHEQDGTECDTCNGKGEVRS